MRKRLPRIAAIAIAVVLFGDVIGLAAMPSGSKKLTGIIPAGNKIVLQRSLEHVRVLVVKDKDKLRLVVAYRQHRRWHSVRVEPAPAGSSAAWAATEGAGPVPAFSAVYGTAPGNKVVVRWHDGKTSDVVPVKGIYLAVRRGHVRPDGVDLNPAPAP